jgi:hypothetical protein
MTSNAELKTLKDLDIRKPFAVGEINPINGMLLSDNYNEGYVDYNDLRTEAIKWIKELDSKTEISPQFAAMYGIKPTQLAFMNRAWKAEKKFTTGWIKHFFNINEDDFK